MHTCSQYAKRKRRFQYKYYAQCTLVHSMLKENADSNTSITHNLHLFTVCRKRTPIPIQVLRTMYTYSQYAERERQFQYYYYAQCTLVYSMLKENADSNISITHNAHLFTVC